MTTQIYDIPDISCAHCQAAIEQSVTDVPGVSEVTVAIDAKTATVTGTAPIDLVTAAIGQAGYDVAAVREQTGAD
jgi:copper chaperone